MSNMTNQETEQENNSKIPEEKIVEWKKAHGDFRAQLPGYARSGFSYYQGELFYLAAKTSSYETERGLREEIDRLRAENEKLKAESERLKDNALAATLPLLQNNEDEIDRLKDLVTRAKPWLKWYMDQLDEGEELTESERLVNEWLADFKKEIGG